MGFSKGGNIDVYPNILFNRDSVILNKVKDLANVSCKSLSGIAFSPYGRRTRFFALLRMTEASG